MEASSGRSRVRPIVIDFLGTLFVTFCIGVTTAVVLAACVVLMAGEARGAAQAGDLAPMRASEAKQGGKVEEVREKMGALFAKLESPVLKGVRIDWPQGAAAETWPARIPDLYAGEPVVVTVALNRAEGRATVSAMRGEALWEQTLLLDQPAQGSGLGVLWARDKIGSLMDAMREGASVEETRSNVIELALTHHLVTKYTSLIAIDRTPARPVEADLKIAGLATNLPEGWNFDAVFGPQQADTALVGRLPQGATDSRFNLLAGALALLFASLLFWQAQARQRARLRLLRLRERRGPAAL